MTKAAVESIIKPPSFQFVPIGVGIRPTIIINLSVAKTVTVNAPYTAKATNTGDGMASWP